ncbi:hypothetical protein C2E23DRAFT_891218 [Lenzites betulinus]|nr:hypothetical protein C2E23DRAFT_891218 [Lenzites betulinus]
MVTFEEGKKKATLVGTVQESIGCVPVHIGASDLKSLVFSALYPVFVEWCHMASLSYAECKIRDKDGVIIEPIAGIDGDRDALPQQQFFHIKEVQRKQRRVFKATKPAEVLLEIPSQVYTKAQTRKRYHKAGLAGDSETISSEDDIIGC